MTKDPLLSEKVFSIKSQIKKLLAESIELQNQCNSMVELASTYKQQLEIANLELIKLRSSNGSPEIPASADVIVNYFDKEYPTYKNTDRTHQSVIPRQILMYILHHKVGMSKNGIAKFMGGLHHTTVLYNLKKVEYMLKINDPLYLPIYNRVNLDLCQPTTQTLPTP